MDYPPNTSAADFQKYPLRFRADAVQEAWVAYLEGGDPLAGASKFASRERRFEKRHRSIDHLDEIEDHELCLDDRLSGGAFAPQEVGLHYDTYHGWCRDDV